MKSLNPRVSQTKLKFSKSWHNAYYPCKDSRFAFDPLAEHERCSDEIIAVGILRSLLLDVERYLPRTKGLQRDLVTLEARIEHEGVPVLSVALARLGEALDKGLDEECFTCPVGFAKPRGMKIPKLFSGIFCIVFDSKTGQLLDGGRNQTLGISLLRQLLYFLEEACLDGRFGERARIFCSDKVPCDQPDLFSNS